MSLTSPERSEVKQTPPPTEIERKFMVRSLPEGMDLAEMKGERIEQGYLANGSGKNTVRLRKKGKDYFLTVKQSYDSNRVERIERECEITKKQFKTLWPATEGRRIEKTRYKIPYGEATIELDVFEGDNAGQMLAEVEFPTTFDAEMFEPPGWLGPDVTADSRFGNSNISKDGFPEDDIPGAADQYRRAARLLLPV